MSSGEIDAAKLRRKVQFLRITVARLREIAAGSREEFLADPITSTASVRYLQIGIESLLDAGHHVIARLGLGLPQTYGQVIDLLVGEDLLPRERIDDYKAMVRFRNRAVHLYDEIDDEEVWQILQTRLGDFDEFLRRITVRFFSPPSD